MNVLFSNFWFRYIFFYILEHYIIFLTLLSNANHFYPNIYILTIYIHTLYLQPHYIISHSMQDKKL